MARGMALRIGGAFLAASTLTALLLPGYGRPSGSVASASVALHASTDTGCGHVARPGTITLNPRIGDLSRVVRVHVPRGYAGTRPVPLVLNLHGSASTAARQESGTGLDETSEKYGFLMAYPQGYRRAGTGFLWNVPETPQSAGTPDDVTYLQQLVGYLRQKYCIRTDSIYLSGFSGGARMTSQTACRPGSGFAAIAVVGGLRAPVTCPAGRAVPVLALHGTADTMNPYNGHGAAYWTYSVPVAAQRWAAYDGCRTGPVTAHPDAGVTEIAYDNCRGDAEVELYALTGKTHRWPAAPTPGAAPGSAASFDANTVIWQFFAEHTLGRAHTAG